jgi:iron complex outermembrane receptor protein
VLALGVATGFSPSTASAQEAAPDAQVIEELVVTAEKREQNLQEVPAAISAFSGDRIEKSGIRNIVDIQFLAAGLNFGQDRDGVLRTSIRGISSNVGVESAVATHLDGVYLANRYDQTGAFFDVARVEVLRGPQGTLYGRNATGGAINIITRDPAREAEAGGQVTFGNYNLIETEGFVTGPILDEKVRGRIAFKTTDLPGYGRNKYDGSRVNGSATTSGRAKLDIDASDAVRVQLSADYTHLQSTLADEISRVFPEVPLQVESLGFVLPREYDSNRSRPNNQDVVAYGGRAKVDWDLGPVTLTSLTGYRRVNSNSTFDIDGTPFDIAYFKFNRKRSAEVTQEFNLSSNGEGPFRWILGAYYLDNEVKGAYQVPIPVFGLEIVSNLISYRTKAYAAFAQASYDFSPSLSLTVGGRYSEESSKDYETRQIFVGAPIATQRLDNSASSFTPKVSLQWKATDDINLYATYAKGFKSGGLNPGAFDGSNFAPEKVTNYEVGLKSLLFDRALMINIAAFYMDYTDLQVNTTVIIPPGIPAVRIVNAAKAEIKGLEADFRAVLGEGFSFDGNLSLLDAKYVDFAGAVDPIGPSTFPFDVPVGARTRSASGNRMSSAPKFSTNLGAEYRFSEVGSWTPTLRGEYSYQSRVYYTPFEDLRDVSQKPVGVFNARLEFRDESEGWTAAVWGRNLTDERMINDATELSASQGQFREQTYRPPRTFGVTVGKSF